MINPNSGSARLCGFDKPRVWSIMNPLAVKTQSINLGQGFPSWQPAEFYRKYLVEGITNGNHQYVRSFGSLTYTKAIAEFHRKNYGEIDHQNSICTAQGGSEALFCIFLGLLDQGDEVILFDPSYDCYRPQVQMAGGKTIGVPLIPKYNQTKSQILSKIEKGVISDERDEWEIDFQTFQKSLNEKTKIVLVNSPHNPTGKVFTNEEMGRIAKILQKYPRIIVVDDNVYQGYTYDDMFEKPLPKIAFQEGMSQRTLSVYSAGKIFSATGVRSGWVVGNPSLIKSVRSVHQYNVFCGYNVIQNALTHSLHDISRPENTYFRDISNKLTGLRNLLVKEILSTPYDLTLWIPKGGHFVLVDISRVQIQQKYLIDEQGNKRTKDYAFAYQLANENRVVCIPMSPFYGEQHSYLGEKYVRFAFCKSEEQIMQASKRMKQQ